MKNADIQFVTGEEGENMDVTFVDDLSGYTDGTLTLVSTDLLTHFKTIAVTVPSSDTVRWAMASTDTDVPTGNYMAQVELTGTGLVKKSFLLSVYVHPDVPSA